MTPRKQSHQFPQHAPFSVPYEKETAEPIARANAAKAAWLTLTVGRRMRSGLLKAEGPSTI